MSGSWAFSQVFQAGEDRPGLPDLGALFGRQAPGHLFDGIKLGDPPDDRVCDG